MGSGSSHMQQQQPMLDMGQHQGGGMPPLMHDPAAVIAYQQQPAPAPYPDMNQIFKGIPKMMQVADDMHRMTNYIYDLRNMMYACATITFLGIFLFLAFRFMQMRKKTSRRRGRPHNNQRTDESEQSSLSISRPNYRHYHSARPVDNWAHKIEMDRMIDSTSTRHTNMTHHGTPGGQHGGSLMLTNPKAALPNSPEHHQQQQQHYGNGNGGASTPLPESTSSAAFQPIIGGCGTGRSSPAVTPTSSGHHQTQQHMLLHHPHHQQQQQQQPNGQLKRLDPVKLVVDEMPYMDNEQEH